MRVVLERLKEKGALQTAVLDAIADRLDALHALVEHEDPAQDSRVFTTLQELEGPLPHLVLRALAVLRDIPTPGNAQERRALWSGFGVDCDAHSTSVLVLGLRPEGGGALATTLRLWADSGRAAVVTLDQLAGSSPLVQHAAVVRVVENPSVLALAQQRLGGRPARPWSVCRAGRTARRSPCSTGCPKTVPSCATTVTSTARGCVSPPMSWP